MTPAAPDTKDHSPESRALDALRKFVRAIGGAARTAETSTGLSGAQLFALRQISSSPGMHLGELAERTMARQSSVSELVGRLVERGLVSRVPGTNDARQVTLSLTAKGKRAIKDSHETAQERLISALESIPRVKKLALAEGLEAWLAAAGLEDVPATMFLEKSR